MGLGKTSFYSAISTGVALIVGLCTNKVTAVFLGTNGMFLLGQLKDFLKIAQIGGNLGTSNGIIKYVAEYKKEPSSYSTFLSTGFKTHLIFSVLVCAATLIFATEMSSYFFKDLKFSTPIVIISFSLITLSLHSFFMSLINGLQKIKLYVTINILSIILTGILLIILVVKFEVIGAFYAIAINQIVTFVISLIFILWYKMFNFKVLWIPFSKTYFKNLTKFTIMAIVAPICLISATFFVRLFLANNLGENYAGSWEAMWRLSNVYIMFLATTFQFYLIPTFSTMDGSTLRKEIFKIWTLSIPLILVITAGIYILKNDLINFLFSKEFLLMNSIILFHLLGDIIKINTWVLGTVLIAKAKTKAFVIFQIGWASIFSILTFVLVKNIGFIGVSLAYFITYILHFPAMNLYFRKLLWSRL